MESDPQIETVRRVTAIFNRIWESGEFTLTDEFRSQWVECPEIVPMRAELENVTYRGRDALDRFAEDLRETWSSLRLEEHEAKRAAGRVVLWGRLIGVHRLTGIETVLDMEAVIEFEGDRIAAFRTAGRPAAAPEARPR